MSFFFVGRRAKSDAESQADPAGNAVDGNAVTVVDLPETGVISHQSLEEIRKAALRKKESAQFVSRRQKLGLRESIRERRLAALKIASAKRNEGRSRARPTLVTRVS